MSHINRSKEEQERYEQEMADFSNRFRTQRIEHGYSFRDLERMSEKLYGQTVSKGTWSKYERGATEPGITKLKMMCKIFNVSMDYMVGLTDDPHGKYKDANGNNLSHNQTRLLSAYDDASEERQKVVREILKIKQKKE